MVTPRFTPGDVQPLICEDEDNIVYYVPGSVEPPAFSPYDTDSDASSMCSQHSASTLSSQEARGYFHDIGGRMFPLDPELPIFMPQDELETHRLDHEHVALKLCLGSNYVGPVASYLGPAEPQAPRKRVLDIGTQQGSWVQEMATEFTHVDFVSLDVSPLTAHIPRENVTFEVYDLYAGLAEPDNSFDLVHVRHMANKVSNYPALLREMHRVLRPGGILLSGEFENETFGAGAPDVPLGDAVPRLSHALGLTRQALAVQGVMVDACLRLPGMLADPALFSSPSSSFGRGASGARAGAESDTDSSSGGSFSSVGSSTSFRPTRTAATPRQTPAPPPSSPSFTSPLFTYISPRTFHIPATTWPDPHTTPALHAAGRRLTAALLRGWPSLVPLFTTHAGLSPPAARELVNGALADHFVDPGLRLILCYHTVWAVKA